MLEKLPKSADFFFDDKDYLIKTDYRLKYLADVKKNPDTLSSGKQKASNPQNGLRKALQDNDLRTFKPKMPVLLCGGNQDPMVFFDVNTSNIANVWRKQKGLDITVLDVDSTNAKERNNMPTLQYIGNASKHKANMDMIAKNVQKEFATELTKTFKASGKMGMMRSYHGILTHTACMNATRQYFAQF